MSDTVIPLLSRRLERAVLVQRLPYLVGAVGLLVDGLSRVMRETTPYALALAAAELLTSLLVLMGFVWVLATARSRTESPDARPSGIDWIDVFLGAMFIAEAVVHQSETNHWPRPTLLLAAIMIVAGVLHGPLTSMARRRRGLRITNKGLSLGGPMRHFAVAWADLKPITIGDRWAVLTTTQGHEHRIDLSDLGNEQQVRDALREAEILRTAKRRFVEKAPPAPSPDNTLYIRPVAPKPTPIPQPAPERRAPRAPRPPTLLNRPTVIQAAGNKPKTIEEFAGRVNSGHQAVSVARMVSPEGWMEPGQQPEFEEITVVLRGTLQVEYRGGSLEVHAGQAVIAHPGEWIRYSSPDPGGAEYVAICLPAFSPDTVHRDDA